MKKVQNRLKVAHYAQIPCKPFYVEVVNEIEAKKIIDILANQHLFLYEQKIIPDYSNSIQVLMWDDKIDEETGKPYGWVDYWNDEEVMEWDEFEETYLIPVQV